MAPEFVFLDIGSTLITGPNVSPNKELARVLDVPGADPDAVGRIIMREDFSGPEDVWRRFKAVFPGVNGSHLSLIATLWERQTCDAAPIEGAIELVEGLKKAGLRIGLISDIWAPYYRAFEAACPEIAALADSATLSFREGIKKPAPELYRRALAALGAAPEQSVMIGDTYTNDLQPAMELGMKTVWFLCRPEREAEALVQVLNGAWPRPEYTVARLMDIPDLDLWR